MEVLYKTTMELYENYFKMLEVAIEKTPESEPTRLQELTDLTKEASEAMQADIALFDKAMNSDMETLASMKDDLKIQDIYKKLEK